MNVLVIAPDARVRRALSGLLESAGYRPVSTAHPADVGPALDRWAAPGLVVLELGRGRDAPDLSAIERLDRLGCPVIAVSTGPSRLTAVLAAGAAACLDEDDPGFADQLTETVRAVADGQAWPASRRSAPLPGRTPGLRQRAPSDVVIPPMGAAGDQPQTATHLNPGPEKPGAARQGP